MRSLLLSAIALIFTFSSFAQLGVLDKIKKSANDVLDGNPAISTNFKDVVMDGILSPEIGEDNKYVNLFTMPRDNNGFFILKPGFYQTTNFSYCLKAGTPGPNMSDAYGLAYLDGKMSDIVEAILIRSQEIWAGKNTNQEGNGLQNTANALASTIKQSDVQVLLWAIIAKANFQNLQGKTKATALALLTPQQIVKLNGGAIKSAVNFASDKGWTKKPEAVRKVEEALQSVRELCYKVDATYEDFERAAILAGLSTAPQIAPTGTWFKHPTDNYYVRFKPQGYSRTTIQIYVPENLPEVKFKGTTMVATPDDSRQRLAQTDWPVKDN